MSPKERADSVRQEAKSVLHPHIAHTFTHRVEPHLIALYVDLKGDKDSRLKACGYVAGQFLKILALTQPDENFNAVLTVTAEVCESEEFRMMLGEVAAEIIEEVMGVAHGS
jgi:hypothetical protein